MSAWELGLRFGVRDKNMLFCRLILVICRISIIVLQVGVNSGVPWRVSERQAHMDSTQVSDLLIQSAAVLEGPDRILLTSLRNL